jgi:hypothetical protein
MSVQIIKQGNKPEFIAVGNGQRKGSAAVLSAFAQTLTIPLESIIPSES